MPESGIDRFGEWLDSQSWDCLDDIANPSQQVEIMEAKFKDKLDEVLPEKTIKTSNDDKPFITPDLKYLDRRKKRE